MDAAASHSILHMVNINRRSASQSLLPPGEYRPTTAHGAQGRVGRMRVRDGEVVQGLGGDVVAGVVIVFLLLLPGVCLAVFVDCSGFVGLVDFSWRAGRGGAAGRAGRM